MQDVGNNGFIHSVSSLQHAFSQICHRATVAELRQEKPTKGEENNEHESALTIAGLSYNTVKSGASEIFTISHGETAEDEKICRSLSLNVHFVCRV